MADYVGNEDKKEDSQSATTMATHEEVKSGSSQISHLTLEAIQTEEVNKDDIEVEFTFTAPEIKLSVSTDSLVRK